MRGVWVVQTKSITFGNFSLNNLVFILFKVSSAFSSLKGKIFYIKVQFTYIAFIIQVLTNAHVVFPLAGSIPPYKKMMKTLNGFVIF